MDRWRKFRRLTPLERRLLLRAMVLLLLTAAAVRLAGFRRWQSALAWLLPGDTNSPQGQGPALLERACLTARMVRAAERHSVGRPNCLRQSLVLWWLLRRQGLGAELRIGVRKTQERLEAHAWVEHCGTVLEDGEDVHQRFAPFEDSVAAAQAGTR